MTAEVVSFPGDTILPISADGVLTGAIAAKLETVIVIGCGPDGVYHAASTSDIGDMLIRIEMFKRDLLNRVAGE